MSPTSLVSWSAAGQVATIVIDTVDLEDASPTLISQQLRQIFNKIAGDPALSACLLVQRGPADGSAGWGSDRSAPADMITATQAEPAFTAVCRELVRFPKAVVTAASGSIAGHGLQLMLCTDFAICSRDATFQLPELSRGSIPAYGGLARLATWVGKGRAMTMALTGAVVTSEDAYGAGLVTAVTEPGDLEARGAEIVGTLATYPPLAVALFKESMSASTEGTIIQPSIEGDGYRTAFLDHLRAESPR